MSAGGQSASFRPPLSVRIDDGGCAQLHACVRHRPLNASERYGRDLDHTL